MRDNFWKRFAAIVLCAAMMMSTAADVVEAAELIPIPGDTASSPTEVTQGVSKREADPSTMDSFQDILDFASNSRNAGRIWADKSVFAYGDAQTAAKFDGDTLQLDAETDGSTESIELDADFLHVYSLLGSSQEVIGVPPVRTVIVFDNSGSMYNSYNGSEFDRQRIAMTVEAINRAIDALMISGRYNEVAVVLFGDGANNNITPAEGTVCYHGNNTAVTILPMKHYTPDGAVIEAYKKNGSSGNLYTKYLAAGWKNGDAAPDGSNPNQTKKDSSGWVFVDNEKCGLKNYDGDGKGYNGSKTNKYTAYQNGTTNIQAGYYVGMQELLKADKTVTVGTQTYKCVPSLIMLTDGQTTDMLDGTYIAPAVGKNNYPKNRGFVNDTGNKLRSFVGVKKDPNNPEIKPSKDKEIPNFWDMFVKKDETTNKYYSAAWTSGVAFSETNSPYDYKDSTVNHEAFENMEQVAQTYSDSVASMVLGTLMTTAYYKEAVRKAYDMGEDNWKIYTVSVDMTDMSTIETGAVQKALETGDNELPKSWAYNINSNSVTMDPSEYFKLNENNVADLSWLKDRGYIDSSVDLTDHAKVIEHTGYPDYSVGEMLIQGMVKAADYLKTWANGNTDVTTHYEPWDQSNGILKSQDFDATRKTNPWDHSNGYFLEGEQTITWPQVPTDDTTNPYGVTKDDVLKNIDYNAFAYYPSTAKGSAAELTNVFVEIVNDIMEPLFEPVGGMNDLGGQDAITYMDPVGKYMDVKDVKNVLLFGNLYGIVKTAVYDYRFNDAYVKAHQSEGLKPGTSPFPEGWYKGDDGATAAYAGENELPTGCDDANDAWDNGWVYRISTVTAFQFLPNIANVDKPDEANEKLRATKYTFYRFARNDEERNELHMNPAYGDGELTEKDANGDDTDTAFGRVVKAWKAEHDRLTAEKGGVSTYPVENDIYSSLPGVYRLSDIRIWVEDTGSYSAIVDGDTGVESDDNFDEAIWINVPTSALPLRTVTISLAHTSGTGSTDATATYSTNVDTIDEERNTTVKNKDALPLRVFYTVGVSDEVRNEAKYINLASEIGPNYLDRYKITTSEQENDRNLETGNVEFFSNWYNSERKYSDYTSVDNEYSFGDPVMTFSPALSNRYYVFQTPTPLFLAPRTDYSSTELGSQIEIESSALGVNGVTVNGEVCQYVTTATQIGAGNYYYILTDYYEFGEKNVANPKLIAELRKGTEFGGGFGDKNYTLCWYNVNNTEKIETKPFTTGRDIPKAAEGQKWVLAAATGGIRTGDSHRDRTVKGTSYLDETPMHNRYLNDNTTRTANTVLLPTVSSTTVNSAANTANGVPAPAAVSEGDGADGSESKDSTKIRLDMYLGNNGRLAVMDSVLLLTKEVDMGPLSDTEAAPNSEEEFEFEVTLDSGKYQSGSFDAVRVVKNSAGQWQRIIDYIDLELDAKMFLQNEKGDPVTVNEKGKVDENGQYYVYVGANQDNGGHESLGNDERNFRIFHTSYHEGFNRVGKNDVKVEFEYKNDAGKSIYSFQDPEKTPPTIKENNVTYTRTGKRKFYLTHVWLFTKEQYDAYEVETDSEGNIIDPTSGKYTKELSYGESDCNGFFIMDYDPNSEESTEVKLTTDYLYNSAYLSQTVEFKDRKATVTLHSDEGLLFNSIPNDTQYTITETLTEEQIAKGYDFDKVKHTTYVTEEDASGKSTGKVVEEEKLKASFGDSTSYSVTGKTSGYESAAHYINTWTTNKSETSINGKDDVTPEKDPNTGLYPSVQVEDTITYHIKWANNTDDPAVITVTDKLDPGVDFVSAGMVKSYAEGKDYPVYTNDRITSEDNYTNGNIDGKLGYTIKYDPATHTVQWLIGRSESDLNLGGSFGAAAITPVPQGAFGEVELTVRVNDKAHELWSYADDDPTKEGTGDRSEDDFLVHNKAKILVGDNSYNTDLVTNPVEGPDKDETEITDGDGTSKNITDSDGKYSEDGTWIGPAVNVGDKITYEITFVNAEKDSALITITDELDPNVSYVEGTDGMLTVTYTKFKGDGTIEDENAKLSVPVKLSYNTESHTVTWVIGTKATAESGTDALLVPATGHGKVSLTVQVKEGAVDSVKNEAQVQVGNKTRVDTKTVENHIPEPEKTETDPGNGKLVGVGEDITYEIKWENANPKDAAVVITDPLDDGVDFVSASIGDSKSVNDIFIDSSNHKTTKTVTIDGHDVDVTIEYKDDGNGNKLVIWTFGEIGTDGNTITGVPAGASGTVTLKVKVNERAVNKWTYSESANSGAPAAGSDYEVLNRAEVKVDNKATFTATVENPVPEKTETKINGEGVTEDGTSVHIGDTVTYKIAWKNGNSEEAIVEITDPLDIGVDFVSAAAGEANMEAPNAPATTATAAGTVEIGGKNVNVKISLNGKTVTWTIGDNATKVPAGASGEVVLTVKVNDKAFNKWTYDSTENNGTETTGEKDNEIVNRAQVKIGDKASFTTEVENPVNEKTETDPGDGKQVAVGDEITYEINWKNGNDHPVAVVITDPLDIGVDYVSAAFTIGTKGKVEYNDKTHTVTWTIEKAPAGASGTVTLVVKVNKDAVKKWNYKDNHSGKVEEGNDYEVVNRAEVSVDNKPTLTTEVENPVPEKTETKIDGDAVTEAGTYDAENHTWTFAEVEVGQTITYSIHYKNSHDTPADVEIVDKLDNGVDFVNASVPVISSMVPGAPVPTSTYSYNKSEHTVTWTLKNVPAHSEGDVTLTVRVNHNATPVEEGENPEGQVKNSATVQVGDDLKTTETVVNPTPQGSFEVTKKAAGSVTADTGDEFTFTVKFESKDNGTLCFSYNETDKTYTMIKDLDNAASGEKKISGNEITFKLKADETMKFRGLPVGTSYTVTEVSNNVSGKYATEQSFNEAVTAEGDEYVIAKDKEGNVVFINTRRKADITLTKTVKNGLPSDNTAGFTFTIELKYKNTVYTENIKVDGKDTKAADGKYTVTLKNGGSVNLSDIPTGVQFKITEIMPDGYAGNFNTEFNVTVTVDGKTETLTHDADGWYTIDDSAAEVSVACTNARKTGNLRIDKTVFGDYATDGDREKEFEFKLKLFEGETPLEDNTISAKRYTIGKYNTFENNPYTRDSEGWYIFKLKHNQYIIFEGIPVGAEYTVIEDSEGKYLVYTGTSAEDAAPNDNAQESGEIVEGTNSEHFFNRPKRLPEKTETDPGAGKVVGTGKHITYNIKWSNDHTEPAVVVITDRLDNGVDFVKASLYGVALESGNGEDVSVTGTASAAYGGGTVTIAYDSESRTVTWTVDKALAGASDSATLEVAVNESADLVWNYDEPKGGKGSDYKVFNRAQVKVGNDSTYTSTVENPVVDISIEKWQSADHADPTTVDQEMTKERFQVYENDTVTYYLHVTVTGSNGSKLTGVTVYDFVPEELTYSENTGKYGATADTLAKIGAEGGVTYSYDDTNRKIEWKIGDVEIGEGGKTDFWVSFDVKVPYKDWHEWKNTGTVSSKELPDKPSNKVEIYEQYGALRLTKVASEGVPKDREFKFTFQFFDKDGNEITNYSYPYVIEEDVTSTVAANVRVSKSPIGAFNATVNPIASYTLTPGAVILIKNGQTLKFEKLPVGATFKITEIEASDFDISIDTSSENVADDTNTPFVEYEHKSDANGNVERSNVMTGTVKFNADHEILNVRYANICKPSKTETDHEVVDGSNNNHVVYEDVKVGDIISYKIDWYNGTEDGTVTVTDHFDENTEFVSASYGECVLSAGSSTVTEDSATITYDGQRTVTWTISNVDALASGYVELKVKVKESAVDSGKGKVENTADVQVDNRAVQHTETVENDVHTGNLRITKAVSGGQQDLEAGYNFTLSLTFGDQPLDGTYNYIISDSSKYRKTEEATTGKIGNGGEFTLYNGETISISDLPEGTKYSVTEDVDANKFDVYVDGELNGEISGTIARDKTVKSRFAVANVRKPSKDETAINGTTTPVEQTDESRTNVRVYNDVKVGDVISYRIDWHNGPDDNATIKVTDDLDPNVEFVSASYGECVLSAGSSTVTEDSATITYDDHTVTWTIQNVDALASGSVELKVKVKEGAVVSEKVDNKAEVRIGDNYKQETETVENNVNKGNLIVTKKVTGIEGSELEGIRSDVGFSFTFKFTYTDMETHETKPLTGEYSYSINSVVKGKILLAEGTYTVDLKHNDTVEIFGLPEGTHYEITENELDRNKYDVEFDNGSGDIVGDKDTSVTVNNIYFPEPHKTEVEPGAGADVTVGQEITYNITWENPYDKESKVVITDPLDKGLDFVSADCEGVKLEKAGEVTENGITVSYTEVGGGRTVKWTFVAQPNTKGSVTLTVRVNENALTIVENTASVSIDHLPEQRTNPVDNPVVDPDVTIEKFQSVGDDGEITKTPLNVRLGDIVTYYLKVTSTGKTTAKNVTVRDAVPNEPAGLTLDEILDGGKLVTPSDPYGFIEWDLGDMEPGEEKTVRFRVLVPKVETATTWINIGEVTYDHPDEPEDPWEPSNEVEIEEKVGGISVTKTVIGSENDQNTEFNFRIELGDGTISGTYGDLEFAYGIAVFKLKHSETVTVKGLPEGTEYTVSEQAESGFETVFTGEVGTVVNDVVAEVEFTNRRVCDLTVQKMISGDNPDLYAEFTFTVTLDDTSINGQYGDMFFTNGVAAFTLKHGESKTAKGLPYGIGYTVTEAEAEGYTPETNGSTGIIGVGSGTVMFVNIPFTPGSLQISKSVEGFYSGERFEFTVVLTNANGEPLTEAFDVVYSNQDAGTIISGGIIILGNGESAVINGLPFGTHYMITENVNEDYTSAVPVAEGVISGSGEAASVSFVNVRKTGGFSVTKTVSGTGSDPTHGFEFTATLSDTSISGQYGDLTFINGVAVFTLAHGETVTATGLPVGITYTVTENSEDYIPSLSNESGVIGEGGIIAVTFNNHKDIIPVFGGLTVTKTVSGTAGDMTKPFTFTVTLSDKSVNGQYGDMFFINGTATFTLTHGQSATAIDLPAGIGYTVTESDNEGYTVTFIGETGVIPENANAQADFFNNKDIIPTGSLSVTKTVTGHTSPEDFLNYFTFVFTFTDAEGNPLPDPYHYSIGSGTGAEGEIVSGGMIQLRHGETATVYGLPEGTRYSVSEIGADGYIPNIIGGEGVISSEFGMSATVSAYNDKPAPPVGDITVTKTVSGTAADYIKQFSFTMTLSDASINGIYGDLTFMNGIAVFTLSHGQSVTASGLPAGIGYSVIENSEDYTVTVDNPSGVIVEGTSVTVNFNNHKDAPPTGGLTVVKTVAGSGADYTRYFSFTVVLSDTSINGQYGGMFFVNGVANFMLRHGESISASGLPAGVTYRIYENDAGDYIVTPSGDSGVIIPDSGAVAEFVNYREEPYVPTGDLTVTKTVTGNAADMTKEFTFTVILSDMSINGQYGDMYFSGGVAFFTLRHGESATASGLPEGISYSVTEADSDGYEVSSSGESGVIVPGARADFVNNKDEDDDEPDEPTGSLTVTKKVTGSGIASQNFTFTVTLSEPLTGQYGDMYFSGGVTTFTLRHGQSMSAVGLPDGISYSVTESDNEYYTVTAIGADGVIIGGGSAYCEYINDLSEEDYPKVLEALDMSISPEDVNPPTGHGYVDHIGTAGLLLIFASLFVISKNRKDR